MAEILISGYYGFHNAGDEAILGGIITAIREVDPSVKFTVISGRAGVTQEIHGVHALGRANFGAIWQAMARTDLLISGGGSLLQDVTGVKSIPYYLGVASMGKLRGLPVMFYANGIGPINGRVGKRLVRSVGNLVDRITVRDRESEATLKGLGVSHPPVEVTADAAFALGPADPDLARPLLEKAGIPRGRHPLIGVAIRRWKASAGEMEQALAKGLDQLAREMGAAIVFIPMQQPQDVSASRYVASHMQERATVLDGNYSYREIQSLIGNCDLLIGMRYHALVFGAMNGVPMVGLSYDPKNDSFLRLIGQEAVGTAIRLDANRLVSAAEAALSSSAAVRQRYAEVVDRLTVLSRRNAAVALELMSGWNRK